MHSRRDFLGGAGFGLAAAAAPPPVRALQAADGRAFTIEKIDLVTVKVPFRDVPARAMAREIPHWQYAEICEARLRCGHAGFGETLLYYTWGRTEDEHVRRALGRNALELLWDDSLGAGLQIALFDAVARAAGVPVYRLLGRPVRSKVPLSWWNIDMPPEDMAAECAEAYRLGYLAYKTKGRPWFDLWSQMDAAAKTVPPEFKIDMDFNATLLDAGRAIPILKDLEKYPQTDIFEEPIPQGDVEGNKKICAATPIKVALHYNRTIPRTVIKEAMCHGFVVGGGASRVLHTAYFCAETDFPFWLQLVGTGITAAWSAHLGAVLSHATWPAVNCHQLYTHPMLTEPIRVEKGLAAVPEKPGLGYELDRDAVERFRVARPERMPDPPRLVETSWPDGRKMYFASDGRTNFVLRAGMAGKIPFYERGVATRVWPDDGSARFRELFEKAKREPVLVKP
jgi:L-alanine-DL-glutamate epimerase-like enolase superfamily enzyme